MNDIEQISDLFGALSAPARLQIILALGTGEACVCHLEAVLGLRQAYISQQLMVLREKGIITSRREGKYIFYSLQDAKVLELVKQAARVLGLRSNVPILTTGSHCECPSCATTEAVA